MKPCSSLCDIYWFKDNMQLFEHIPRKPCDKFSKIYLLICHCLSDFQDVFDDILLSCGVDCCTGVLSKNVLNVFVFVIVFVFVFFFVTFFDDILLSCGVDCCAGVLSKKGHWRKSAILYTGKYHRLSICILYSYFSLM